MDWLIGHLVGDYLLQNDWMAQGKKWSSWRCSVHCAIWTASVWAFTQWPLWTVPVLFATHFVQDRTRLIDWYMGAIGQLDFRERPMAPWSVIVVDNVWHLVMLYGISTAVQ